MGALGDLIQVHVDNSVYGPSDRQLALRIGISPTALGHWRRGGITRLPQAVNLRRAATVLQVPYAVVLNAALTDAGYLPQDGDGYGQQPAPIDDPGGHVTELHRMDAEARAAAAARKAAEVPDDLAARKTGKASRVQRKRDAQDHDAGK